MANLSTKQCSVCHVTIDETWTKFDKLGNYICPCCGSVNFLSEDVNQTAVDNELNSIYPLLENAHFKTAREKLESLRNKYPQSSKAWFLSVLADNYVCFTKDNKEENRYIPTLNDLPDSDLSKSVYAKKALELAESDLVKESYQAIFDYIDKKRLEILEAAKNKENQYDIFISTKVTLLDENSKEVLDGNGNPKESPDCANARMIYSYILEKYPGKKIFFSQSEEAKKKMSGQKYENVIYAALHSAKAFILVAESRQSIDWRWVRNEWMRYLRIMEREKDATHSFVLVTHSLTSVDLPGELKDFQFINYSTSADPGSQLKFFLNNALLSSKEAKKLEAKTFSNEVEKVELGEVEEAVITRKLKTRVEEASHDLKIKLGRIAMDLNPERMATREKAFQELEKIVEDNPDVYEAKKLLLLKGTNYYHLEDYFNDPVEISKDTSILAKYFEIAPEAEAKKLVKEAVSWFSDWDNNVFLTIEGDSIYFKGVAPVLTHVIMPYLDYIDKRELEDLSDSLLKMIPFSVDVKTEEGKAIIDAYLSIRHYLDGKDPKKYIKARTDLLKGYADIIGKCDQDLAAVEERLTSEILKINPGYYEIIWFDFCYKHLPKIYKISELNKLIADIGEEKILLPIVGNKENIDVFKKLFKYSSGKERDAFVSVFLMSIVFDKKSYEKESGTDSLLLTKDIDGDNQIDDYEKNGFDLFKDYIGYSLMNIEYSSTNKEDLKPDSPYLKPSMGAYLNKEKPTLLDRLLCSFAVKMHRDHFYEQAVMLYDWYLGEQESGKTLDALLVRYYKELATVRILEPNELKHVNRRINDSDIKDDLYALSEKNKSAMVLYNKISDIVEKQDRYFDVYQPIKELTNQLPVEKTAQNVDLICELRDKIYAAIEKAPEDLKKDLRDDFSYELDYFKNELPRLIASRDKAKKKKKAIGITITVSTIVAVLVIAALVLTFFVFIPQAKQADYDAALGFLNTGNYQEAALRFEQVGYKDSPQMYYVAKAGASFEEGDYETGIEYIHDAGGTVNITYDSNGGTSSKNTEVLKRKNKWIDNVPTKNGYTFKEWKLDGFVLNYADEDYKADLSLKASWNTIAYRITYDSNGGKVSGNKNSYTIEDEFSLVTPTRSGYTFLGWYDDSDNKVESIKKGTVGDLRLVARWEANAYTITLNPAGGSVSQTTINVQYDSAYELPLPTRSGYSFLGWFDNDNYQINTTGKWIYISGKSLTARWSILTYHIYYELNGGTLNNENPTTYTVEDSFVLKAPTRIGYTFLGWFDGGENKIDSINKGLIGDMTLVAKWSEANNYIVTLDADGGDVLTNEISVQYDHAFSLPTPTKLGYSFQGWFDGENVINESEKWNIASDISLKAHWAIINYTINYVLNGGDNSKSNPQLYTVEDEYVFANPSRDGYSFDGWYVGDTLVDGIGKGTTGSITFEARWSPKKHTVYVSSSDESKGTANIVSGSGYTDETIEVEAIAKTGNVFLGWYRDGGEFVSSSNVYSFTMPNEEYIEVTARFASQADVDLGKIPVQVGNTVYYGLYPQDSVTDSSLISKLNSSATSTSNGWYLYNGSYYAKKDSTWFYCQRIQWSIMSNGTLLSKKILDVSQYNSAYSTNSKYISSDIRTYLNGSFYNSAFALNSSYITVTTVDNSGPTTNVDNNQYASSNTSDRVFIPSYKEALNLGSCSSTAWAGSTTYWTRSPNGTASSSRYVWYVQSDGSLAASYPMTNIRGIRPCISISY